MSEPTEPTEPTEAAYRPVCGWVRPYHTSGLQVTLPVTTGPLDYAAMFANVDALLAAGWLVRPSDMKEGEHVETIGWVARRPKTNKDGSESVVIDLYADEEQLKHKFLITYLDDDDDVKAFEYASGLELEHIPLMIAQAPAERGKNAAVDKYIIRVPHPFGVVWKPNPKYDEVAAKAAEAADKPYLVPKKAFVRWERERPAKAADKGGHLTPAQAESLFKEAKSFLASDPPLAEFNKWWRTYQPKGPADVVHRFWSGLRAHAKVIGWVWHEQKGFVAPEPESAPY